MKFNWGTVILTVVVLWIAGYALQGIFDWGKSTNKNSSPVVKEERGSKKKPKEYIPTSSGPDYRPLPEEESKEKSNISSLPEKEQSQKESNIRVLPEEKSKKTKPNYHPLGEAEK